MNIAIIGASGFVGSALVKEALQRGHTVTAIARDISKIKEENSNLHKKAVDVADNAALLQALKGSDLVISAYNAGWTNPNLYHDFLEGSKAIQTAVKASAVKRFIAIGGAGSLYIAPGTQLVDSPDFPEAFKAGATAARDYLNYLKEEQDIDWTFFSPAIEMHHGINTGRTGQYRTGLEHPVFDSNNRSVLSVEDLAVAVLDEAEQGRHIRQRFTAAY
ncbi:NAD(P)-dependent oxidoreductase [Taibaiella helva]|uniref:NAD(P)-dependent oxidoreductase n=1 Tax=Taibaiella helva TaxID=2301235 RepID=UPI000E56EC92|nr:NAD(P)H-binding protein [Taibaiella helva]